MIMILILHMHLGMPARVIVLRDSDLLSCGIRSVHEMQLDKNVRKATCTQWQGGQV